MSTEISYDLETIELLKKRFLESKLHRPMHINHYEPGTNLVFDMTAAATLQTGQTGEPGQPRQTGQPRQPGQPVQQAAVSLVIEKFVGGGFAGQVYRVKILAISPQNAIPNLEINGCYAMKILVPPSGFSRFFRSLVYRIGFQAPFQPQVNESACRAGALWQKFIRRAAGLRFGSEKTVNDIHATFVDSTLGSCGELSDWVDGRTWRLEVDDHLDSLKDYLKGKEVTDGSLGSPEYRAKKEFMRDFVQLLHDLGAHEFARQYQWSTCKSQPNCLKRKDCEDDPAAGLTAVDFRAGLALLPFLPMSPGDFMLILKGIGRGSLVQFDRGDVKKLERFIAAHPEAFAGMGPQLETLKELEKTYRYSQIDITHNFLRLFYSRKFWSTWLRSTVEGWRIQGKVDAKTAAHLHRNKLSSLLFYILGALPFLGSLVRKLWGRQDMRRHYGALLSSWNYFKRAVRGKCIEKASAWHRDGRMDSRRAIRVAGSLPLCLLHLPFSLLPVGLHRLFTQWQFIKECFYHVAIRPFQLYFNAAEREKWLRDMVRMGKEKYILTEKDAAVIESQIEEPFIQKYLKSLAVHVMTLPVTQVVSITVSWIYVHMHPELTGPQAAAAVAAILILFQVTPISPGSLARGFYSLSLVIRERNFKDYNIALFLSFFKYIGYLAFPIQMTYRYPELARFMAGHWATEAVHFVPVFGERGALLEHWVFRLFYNWPLTIRRRMRARAQVRAQLQPRYRHIPLLALVGMLVLACLDVVYLYYHIPGGTLPGIKMIWPLAIFVAFFGGAAVNLGCGGAVLGKRIAGAAVYGVLLSLFHTAAGVGLALYFNAVVTARFVIEDWLWCFFIFTLLATAGAIINELRLPGHAAHAPF